MTRRPGETALVTGANTGIGKEIARGLANAGLIVYLGARDEQRGQLAVRELSANGSDVRWLRLDVTDQAQVDAAVGRIDTEVGCLDVLVNNAGVVLEWRTAVPEVTTALLRESFEVNVFGPVAMTNACIPLLRRSRAGRVVNLSSPLGSLTLLSDQNNPISSRGLLAYSSSKAALNAITVLYANALRPDGIRVNAVSPGLVATGLNVESPFPRGSRTPAQGALGPVRLALMGPDGPTGQFLSHQDDSADTAVPW